MQKAQSVGNSIAGMKFAGLADHSCPTYRKLVESYWIKSELASRTSRDGSFGLCELILYLIDGIQEDVKAVVRYKTQFRALLAQILALRPMVEMIEDFLAYGISDIAQMAVKGNLIKLLELLKSTRKQVVLRHQQKSGFRAFGSERSLIVFTKQMNSLAAKFQKVVDQLHKIFVYNDCILPSPDFSMHGDWEPISTPTYDSTPYSHIHFTSIDFDAIFSEQLAQKRAKKTLAPNHVSVLLEEAEILTEQGKLVEAKEKLSEIDSGEHLGLLTNQDRALFQFLKAKINAKLMHHDEALKALEEISNSGIISSNILESKTFQQLESSKLLDIKNHWRKTVARKYFIFQFSRPLNLGFKKAN